jgi:methionine-rich copper-binding protein CopC
MKEVVNMDTSHLAPFISRKTPLVHWSLPWVFALLLASIALLAITPTASAHVDHAEYVSSTPATNAMLSQVPSRIVVHFSENVDPAGSDILVYDVDGKQLNAGPAQVDTSDLKTMTVNVQASKSEVVVVVWHTVSAVEGHHDSGSFRFFVNISPMLKGMLNGQMPGSTSTPSSSSSSSVPTWVVALITGVLGLIIGGGGAWFFARQGAQKNI